MSSGGVVREQKKMGEGVITDPNRGVKEGVSSMSNAAERTGQMRTKKCPLNLATWSHERP